MKLNDIFSLLLVATLSILLGGVMGTVKPMWIRERTPISVGDVVYHKVSETRDGQRVKGIVLEINHDTKFVTVAFTDNLGNLITQKDSYLAQWEK